MDALEECEAAIAGSRLDEGLVTGAVARLAEAMVPVGERFHFLLAEQLDDDPKLVATDARVMGPIKELAERGRRDGTFRADVSAAWIAGAIEALLYAASEGVDKGELVPLDVPG